MSESTCDIFGVTRRMKEYKDVSGRLSIDLDPNHNNFEKCASRLESVFSARSTSHIEGLDQRYWDYEIDGTTVVLHSDVMAGVSIFIQDGSREDPLCFGRMTVSLSAWNLVAIAHSTSYGS